MSFAFKVESTHFYLWYNGPLLPTPTTLDLSVDGRRLVELPVLEQQPAGSNYPNMIMADVPGDMFVKQVMPPMLNANTLTVRVGQSSFSMPITGYKEVASELFDCAYQMQSLMKH